jgi:NitT/TauT family transport system substrate-binding protein
MFSRSRVLAAGLLATVLLGASACSSSSDDAASTGTDGGALEKVTYLTTFGNAGRDAFAWVALEKGYFKEAGLDVDIQLGKATGDNVAKVSSGAVQYSNLDMMGAWILQSGNKNFQGKFHTIAAVHQQTLVSVFTLEGSGINTPADLAGKEIGAAANSVNQALFPAYAKLAGIKGEPKWRNVQPADVNKLLAGGAVPAVSTFLIAQGGIETLAKPKKTKVFRYNDYLQDLYGNGIVASDQVIKDKPEQVKKMREALMKGLEYTVAHPDEAVQILKKYQPAIKEAAAKGEITLMSPYVPAAGGAPVGSLEQGKVAKALAILQGAGVLKDPLTPESVVAFDMAPSPKASS